MAMPSARKTFGQKNAPQRAPATTPMRKRSDVAINPFILAGGGALLFGTAVVMMLDMDAPVRPAGGPAITELPARPQPPRSNGSMGAVSSGLSSVGR